ncbi:uncharacterized protein N7479_008094 [Penicillium vulpinum]|uniref:Rhodopsin domain-containing protein n=1 Tax=Penicillium vulpinum TaxID=29845 RepID=A0A1V6R8P1_9EURO|nr:uncharacterized protein N7479_008094 [Penicillium vulpinum]KAJ5960944.1 hypothetical protein N7479_008094 [Penicillium vulpinum]OQD97880.1 hypothetical protein PENVUL_c077G09014 [Penicillium vulpinum]
MGHSMPLEGRSLAIFIVSIVMMSISIITVSLRSFVRLNILRAFGWDDALMVAALILFIILNACCIVGSSNGVGHPRAEFISTEIYQRALIWWWLGQMLYIWASVVAKISIALALLRLAVKKSYRLILWSIIATVITIGLMFWFVLLFTCNPISHFWRQVDGTSTGTCLHMSTIVNIAYFYSSVTILCDIALGLLPAFLIWKLQMNSRTKFAVGGILGLGAIASVAVICRIPFLRFYADENFLYTTYQIAIWSIIETGLGIIAGSLVTLRPLFRWLLDENSTLNHKSSREGKYCGPYRLSSLKSEPTKGSQNTKYWRPDVDPDDNKTVIVVSSQRKNKLSISNSSQEALNPEPGISPNHVTIEKTFIQTVTEGKK